MRKGTVLSLIAISAAVLMLKGYMYVAKDPVYSHHVNGHLFWHPAYLGLSSHPKSFEKYGIYLHDSVTGNLVAARTEERFGTEDWQGLGGYYLFEDIVKEEYLSILKNDPVYVLENYAVKPYLFFKTFFNSHYWLNNVVLSATSVVGVLVGGLLLSGIPIVNLFQTSLLLISGFIFSLIPAMFLTPEVEAYIAEPSLLFLSLLYWIFSLLVALFVNVICNKIRSWKTETALTKFF